MELEEAIKNRRSIRRYKKGEEVEKEKLIEILDAGRWAPSAGNLQSREFMVVDDERTKDLLCEAALGRVLSGKLQLLLLFAPI